MYKKKKKVIEEYYLALVQGKRKKNIFWYWNGLYIFLPFNFLLLFLVYIFFYSYICAVPSRVLFLDILPRGLRAGGKDIGL